MTEDALLVLEESRPHAGTFVRALAVPALPELLELWNLSLNTWTPRTVALVSEGHCGRCGARLLVDPVLRWLYCPVDEVSFARSPETQCRTAWRMSRMSLGDFLETAR